MNFHMIHQSSLISKQTLHVFLILKKPSQLKYFYEESPLFFNRFSIIVSNILFNSTLISHNSNNSIKLLMLNVFLILCK